MVKSASLQSSSSSSPSTPGPYATQLLARIPGRISGVYGDPLICSKFDGTSGFLNITSTLYVPGFVGLYSA